MAEMWDMLFFWERNMGSLVSNFRDSGFDFENGI